MDLFFLGLFHFPVREVGFYAAALKIAGFSMALPLAMTNLFNIWLGRKIEQEGMRSERDLLKRLSWFLLLGSSAQSALIWFFAPMILGFLSRGRWSAEEQALMTHWLLWIMAGFSIWSSTFLVSSWLALRSKVSDLCLKVYVPWGLCSVFVYAWAVYFGGFEAAAKANVVVSGMYVCFLWSHWVGYKKNNP
jgi:Na+-driven multidrug efflux pump